MKRLPRPSQAVKTPPGHTPAHKARPLAAGFASHVWAAGRPGIDDHATSTAGTDRLLVDWSALATRSGTSGPSHIADILSQPAFLGLLRSKTGGSR